MLKTQSHPSQLIYQLVDHLIDLGDLAREIKRALAGNSHYPEEATAWIEQLINERR